MGTIKDFKYKKIKNFLSKDEIILLDNYCRIKHRVNFENFDMHQNPNGDTYYDLTTDYTLINTTTSWFRWRGALDFPSTQDFEVHIDTLASGHTNVAVSLYGRKFAADSWTQIGSTVNWTITSADTTIIISNTTINRYREFKSNYVGTGTGTCTIANQQLKLYKE